MARSALLILLGLGTAMGAVTYQTEISPGTSIAEGQEVRIALKATGATFDSVGNDLEVRIYKDADGTCTQQTGNGVVPLWTSTTWGMVVKPTGTTVDTAAMTFVAPPTATGAFIICFKHASGGNTWTTFTTTVSKWTSVSSSLTFSFPYATVGQNAVGMLQVAGMNFQASASSCYTTSTPASCSGDFFKFVTKGAPCTVETNDPSTYFGTNKVASTGLWTDLGDAQTGVVAGSIGLGAIGSNTVNPLISSMAAGSLGNTAYVYVTIPSQAYDVCYSSKDQRAAALTLPATTIINAVPVWRKIKGCDDTSSACKTIPGWTFTPNAETVKWLAADLTPTSYATLVFNDLAGGLNTFAHIPVNYYTSAGGDMFKIVSADKFSGAYPIGCWDTTNEAFDLTLEPTGSKDLHGDPTNTAATNNAMNQQVAFGNVWIPASGTWHVCYKTTKTMTGFRVITYTNNPSDATARRFVTLASYSSQMLIPGKYALISGSYPPTTQWTMADRRATTYGPVMIQATTSGSYDARASSYWSTNPTMYVRSTVGSAMRLVPKGNSCFDTTGAIDNMDAGAPECMTSAAGSDRTNCMGSLDNSPSRASLAFYVTLPASGSHSVCFKHQGFNWLMLATDLAVAPAPTITLSTEFTDTYENEETFFSVYDASGANLETGDWKDIFRLVPNTATCDINPTSFNPYTATYLSVYCKNNTGYGVLDPECANTPNVKNTYCRGLDCSTDDVTLGWLKANLAQVNPIDDIVPFDYAAMTSRVGAFVLMPPLSKGARWNVCYRQFMSGYNNWQILGQVQLKSPSSSLIFVSVQTPLLGGSQQQFGFVNPYVGGLTAKLVPYSQSGHCGNPAGGSDANPIESMVQVSGWSTGVTLMVPQTAWKYFLCVQRRPNMWVRGLTYAVADNGVRWFTMAGNQPYNGAALRINLIKGTCVTSCDFGTNHDMFDIDKGADAAKVVAVGSDCSSDNVDLNGATVISDLGPGEGDADIAEAIVTLPAGTAKLSYKVCVKTNYDKVPRWVQVAQASGVPSQVAVEEQDHHTPQFVTMISDVSYFEVLAGIRPSSSTYKYPLAQTVIAGSGTSYVQNRDLTTTSIVNGFIFHPSSGRTLADTHMFKLVHKSIFDGRWGSNFNEVPFQASCLNESVETTTNTRPCSNDGCPRLVHKSGDSVVTAVFQFPVDPASYIVCYRNTADMPWVQVKASTGGNYIYAIPSMLEFEPSASPIAIFDRSMAGSHNDIPSWCSDSTNHGCPTTGYTSDYVTVVDAAKICEPPATSGAAVPPTWFPLKQNGNPAIVIPDGNTFSLPPQGAQSTAYKVCVYKSGSEQNLQKGLVYQLYNRGSQDGYWREGASVRSLEVSTTLAFDSAKQFMEVANVTAIEDMYSAISTGSLMTDGKVYRTPAIRSGGVIEFEVLLPGYSNEVVTVEVCQAASSWSDLACQNVDTSGTLMIRNVDGTCAYQHSGEYDWLKGGLSQHALSGRVQFRLQIMSACSSTDGFGCGIRFTAGGVSSAPQWFNILPHYPDSVAINGNYVNANTPSNPFCTTGGLECEQVVCATGTYCDVHLQARYQGPAEYSALGQVAIDVLTVDSMVNNFFAKPWRTFDAVTWNTTGTIMLHFTPEDIELKAGVFMGNILLRLTYGNPANPISTAFQLKIVRPRPAAIKIVSVAPMDQHLSGSRTPTPAFMARDPSGPLLEMLGMQTMPGSPQTLTAADDSYIESLVPYELRYTVFDDMGKPMTQGDSMVGWTVTASLESSTQMVSTSGNQVMRVLMDGDKPSPRNLWTTPMTQDPFEEMPMLKDNGWTQHFRVKNNRGCSRFSPCYIKFTWSNNAGSYMYAYLMTPVRVIGSITQASVQQTSSSVMNGITVVVEAGTYSDEVGWMPDEYHYGNAFALFDDPSAPEGTQMAFGALISPDPSAWGRTCIYAGDCVNSCSVFGYPFRVVSGKWAAMWVLKTDRQCLNCKFTFHSDMGASPYYYGGKEAGAKWLTFLDSNNVIQCSANLNVKCTKYSPTCDKFDLTVSLITPEVVTCEPPKWRVYLDPTIAVTRTSGVSYSLDYNFDNQTVALGMDSVATFANLQFKLVSGTLPPTSTMMSPTELRTITVRAMRYVYGKAGNTNHITTWNYTCTTTVGMTYQPLAPETTWMELTGLTGATAMCNQPGSGASFCANWYTTTALLKQGLTFNARFRNTTEVAGQGLVEGPDMTTRNFVIIPDGGYYTLNRGQQMKVVPTGVPVTLGSAWDTTTYHVDVNKNTWSWGAAQVVFAGDTGFAAASNFTMMYADGATEQPARELRFTVCSQVGNDPIPSSQCKAISLWVILEQAPTIGLSILTVNANTDLTAGRCTEAGLSPATVTVTAYYQLPNISEYFYVYTEPLKYTLTFPGQLFWTSPTAAPMDAYSMTNPVAVSENIASRLQALGSKSLVVSMTVYGTKPLAENPFAVTLTDMLNSEISVRATTTSNYTYVEPTPDIYKWTLLESVAYGNTCPNIEPSLAVFSNYYRTYEQGTVPGQGWAYTSGAVVGVPFPVQTLVINNGGTRAYTFKDRKVRVSSVKPFIGCNEAKDLKVYTIKPTTGANPLYLPGTMSSWDQAPNNAVPTDRGLATPWVVIEEPVEKVILQLDLCYDTTDAAQCLTAPTNDSSDARPISGDRTMFTKPFSVRPRMATHLQVVTQDIPEATIQVGKTMSVQLEAVQLFGKRQWSITDATQRPQGIYVSSTYYSAPSGLMYGNGGFMKASDARDGCSSPLSANELAASRAFVPFDPSNLKLMFYFARPCTSCGINVHYVMHGFLTTFSLRQWHMEADLPMVGSVLQMKVTTCGSKWVLSGVPPVAVHQRKAFSVSALRVDANNFPSWDSNDQLMISKTRGVGNGMGGTLMLTSPAPKAIDGRATARVAFSRPCFMCKIMLGATHTLTVLTDADSVILLPTAHDMMQRKTMETSNSAALWDLQAYWSDSRGYRAYTSAGPSQLSFMPRYIQQMTGLAEMAIGPFSSHDYSDMIGTDIVGTLTTGNTPVQLVNATHMINGIPFQLDALGRFTFSLTGPAIGYEVNMGLPTLYMGMEDGFQVDFTVPATKMAIDKTTLRCATTYVNSPCTFRAYAIGQVPGALNDAYYVSTTPVPPATTSYTCVGSCAVLEISGGTFNRGIASISATASEVKSSGCRCDITVKHPSALADATDQVFTMYFDVRDIRPVVAWLPTSKDMYASSKTSMYSHVKHQVAWDLIPVASDKLYSDATLNTEISFVTVDASVMQPQGCFVCSSYVSANDTSKCAVTQTAAAVTLKGYFTSTGPCTITTQVINGLPVTGSANLVGTDYTVTVFVDVTMGVLIQEFNGLMGSTSFFKSLTTLTNNGAGVADGMPAAVQAAGSGLQFVVFDSGKQRVSGDYHSIATVDTFRDGTKVDTTTVKAVQGIINVPIKPDMPTHSGSTHKGYTFDVSIMTDYVGNTTNVELAKWTLGPLYVVKAGTMLRVSIAEAGSNNWVLYTPEMHWIQMKPFDIKVEMLDGNGQLVADPGDHGDDALLTIQPLAIPCYNVDTTRGYLTSTCIAGGIGSCIMEPQIDCVDGWRLGAEDMNGVVSDRDAQMAAGIATFSGLRWVHEEGVQGLFIHAEPKEQDLSIWPSLLRLNMQRPVSLVLDAIAASYEVSDTLSFRATLLDQWGNRVEAENFTTFSIVPSCGDVGVNVFFQIMNDGKKVLANRVTVRAVGGVVAFGGLYLSNVCNTTKVTISPLVYSEVMPPSVMVPSTVFKIVNTNNATVVVPKPFKVILSLGLGGYETLTGATEFIMGVWASELVSRGFTKHLFEVMRRNVQTASGSDLLLLCAVPAGRAQGGITSADRAGNAPDGGKCVDRMQAVNMNSPTTRTGTVLAGGYEVLAEFDVLIDMDIADAEQLLKDALTQDLSSATSSLKASNPEVFANADINLAILYTPEPTGALAPEFEGSSTVAPALGYLALLVVGLLVL
eukprot:TRINITY_DN413_c1_g1_i1.p1 TRINITY_DN413_c1_g1~~TRINITY_DN413_c1_g1_i1.p1  ORF type:complete len:3944 (+),score=986.90 TRINITY_DN413_c1_g1_i1:61-11892(+)